MFEAGPEINQAAEGVPRLEGSGSRVHVLTSIPAVQDIHPISRYHQNLHVSRHFLVQGSLLLPTQIKFCLDCAISKL